MGYPEHNKIIKKLSKKYHKQANWDIDDLIKDIVNMIVKEKFA